MIYNKSVRMRIHINVEGSNFSIVFWFCRGYSILSLGDILSFLERKKKEDYHQNSDKEKVAKIQ